MLYNLRHDEIRTYQVTDNRQFTRFMHRVFINNVAGTKI